MGINVKVQKSPKPIEIIISEARLERDLKSCMRCRYFHGNNRQCIAKKCVKEEKKQPEITVEEKQSKVNALDVLILIQKGIVSLV